MKRFICFCFNTIIVGGVWIECKMASIRSHLTLDLEIVELLSKTVESVGGALLEEMSH